MLRADLRCLLLFVIVACGGCSRSGVSGPIILGHLADSKDMGDEYAGIVESTYSINAEKDRLPLGQHVGLIFGDLGKAREHRVAQVFRLSSVDRVPVIIGGTHSSIANHINSAIQSEKAVGIVTAGHPAGSVDHSAVFCIGISPKSQGAALAEFVEKNGWQSVTILHSEEHPSPVLGLFREAIRKARISQFHVGKEINFSAMIKRIAASKPAAILAIGSAEEVAQWRTGLADFAQLPWLFGGEECELHRFQPRDETKYPLFAACSGAQLNNNAPAYKTMRDKFHQRHERQPTIPCMLGWEAIQIATEAIRRADSTDPEKIREQLTKPDAVFPVLTGELRFNPDRTAHRPVHLVSITESGLSLVQEYP